MLYSHKKLWWNKYTILELYKILFHFFFARKHSILCIFVYDCNQDAKSILNLNPKAILLITSKYSGALQ